MKSVIGVIALLTDVGESEPYSASIKGIIIGICPEARIVTISNSVPSFDLEEASYILLESYRFFPPGTIFVVVVVPGVGESKKSILVVSRNYYFIGPDNGVLIPAASNDGIEKILLLNKNEYYVIRKPQTFHGRDIYAPIAARLCCRERIENLGTPIDESEITGMDIKFTHSCREGYVELKVLHIDKYGNVILSEYFKDFIKDFSLEKGSRINVHGCNNIVATAVFEESFCNVHRGTLILYENSYGLVELAVNEGSAQQLLQVSRGDLVRIDTSS